MNKVNVTEVLDRFKKAIDDIMNLKIQESDERTIATRNTYNSYCQFRKPHRVQEPIAEDYEDSVFQYTIEYDKSSPENQVERRNKLGETSLHVACRRAHRREVYRLLNDNVNVNTQDNAGWTPLHEAILGGDRKIIKLLLKCGAIVNAPGYNYTSPLEYAVRTKNLEATKILFRYGADPTNCNFDGVTPMELGRSIDWEALDESCENRMKKPRVVRVSSPCRLVFYILEGRTPVLEKFLMMLKKFVKFDMADIIDESVTHVITKSGLKIIPATRDMLLAIAHTVPVVTVEWLHACYNYAGLVDYEEYYLIGTDTYSHDAVKKSQISKFNMCPKLFSGCHFFISVGEGCPLNEDFITTKQLAEIIVAGGGKILRREPTAVSVAGCGVHYPWHAPAYSSIKNCCHYIIYDPDSEPMLRYSMTDLRHVPFTWVFESILRYKLVPPEDAIEF